MSNGPADSEGILGEVGNLLQGAGAYFREFGQSAPFQAAGRVMEAVGVAVGGLDQVADATLEGKGPAEIAGSFIGQILGGLVPAALLAGPQTALLMAGFAAFNPVLAPFVFAGLATLAGWALGEILEDLGAWIDEKVGDLLRAALYDPLVLDLDGDGVELTALANSATLFDLDDDGVAERAGWVGPHDGLLIHDLNGNGLVDGVGELFGSGSVDGFDELSTIDASGDGKIDANDPAFAQLLVWRDLNADGVSTADEMLTLAQAGVVSLNLGYTPVGLEVAGNVIARAGSYARADNSTRTMASVQFALDQTTGRPAIPEHADISDLIILPNLAGSAVIPDLRTAMYFDPVLKAMVAALIADGDFDTFAEFAGGGLEMAEVGTSIEGRFLEIIYRWTGVDVSGTPNPDRPFYYDVFEALTGMTVDPNSHSNLDQLADIWPQLVRHLGVQFLFQAVQNAEMAPLLGLADSVAALDPDDPAFLDNVAALVQSALNAWGAVTPAYDFLENFTGLLLNPVTGELSGDFDAFVARFIQDQPSFFASGFSGSGGNGTISMGGGSSSGDRHSWTAWYEDHGSLLFTVANAMGIDGDHVLTLTGWRWLAGGASDHHGTAGDDLLNFEITTVDHFVDAFGVVVLVDVETHDQRLFGYEGNDELRGNDGVDRLVGGTGNDLLSGGSGSDMYVYASDDGLDRIIDVSGGADIIYFSSELNSADLRVSRLTGTNDLLVHFGSSSAGIILTDQWASSAAAIEQFHFVGEDGLDAGDIASLYLATLTTAGADTITGSWADETIEGADGADILFGQGGDDRLLGGLGSDALNGNNGNDGLLGGEGADVLFGGDGEDILVGGTGDDDLQGGGQSDTYFYNLGDGNDVIFDYWGRDYDATDVLSFGAGITPDMLQFSRVAHQWNDIVISFLGHAGSIRISGQHWGDAGLEQITFADGTVWNHAQMMARYVADQQTSGDDVIFGSPLNDVAEGGAGNDRLELGDGEDVLIGGTGDDDLQGGGQSDTYVYNLGDGNDVIFDYWGRDYDATDVLSFGAGITPGMLQFSRVASDENAIIISFVGNAGSIRINGQHWGDAGLEQITFADGTVWNHAQMMARYVADQHTSGDDMILGSPLSDLLEGGAGNDWLSGGAGGDVYRFNRGDGQDIIFENGYGADAIEFGANITPADIVVSQVNNGNHLVLAIRGTSDRVTIEWALPHEVHRIEQIRFADGTVWAHNDLVARAVPDNLITGTASADSLWGTSGVDRFDGLTGDDALRGGYGADTYIYRMGDGSDYIDDEAPTTTDVDVLQLLDLNSSDVTVSRNGVHSQIRVNATGSIITLDEQFWNGDHWGIDRIVFANGEMWDRARIRSESWVRGGLGNDTLYGTGGGNTFDAGLGDDTIRTGWGADAFVYRLGDGNDYIDDEAPSTGEIDTLRLLGINSSDVALSRSGSHSIITISSTGHTITLEDQFWNGDHWGIDRITFANGETWDRSRIEAESSALRGGPAADALAGTLGGDAIYGAAGDDSLVGGSGSDWLIGGSGADTLTGGLGGDTFVFTASDFPSAGSTSVEHITDFDASDGDLIDLSGIDAIAGGPDDGFTFIGSAAFSSTAGELRSELIGGTTYVCGDINGDGVGDFQLELHGGPLLVPTDFLL